MLAVAVATGLRWLGFLTYPGKVLFINLEIPAPFLKHRLSQIAKAMNAPALTNLDISKPTPGCRSVSRVVLRCPNVMLPKFDTRTGFTLLELLAVIAIIAVLAGLILPVYGRAKAKAGKTACINNLRQVSLAVRMYADDSNDNSPATKTGAAKDPFTAYKEYLKGYVGSQASRISSVFACPGDKFYYDYDTRISRSLHAEPRNDYSSYVFNAGNAPTGVPSGMPPVHPWPGIAGRRLGSIQQPERTLLVVEYPALQPYSWHEPVRKSHYNNARNVVSYVDGHVSYIKIYWNTNNTVVGSKQAWHYDPPPGYDYKWSGD